MMTGFRQPPLPAQWGLTKEDRQILVTGCRVYVATMKNFP